MEILLIWNESTYFQVEINSNTDASNKIYRSSKWMGYKFTRLLERVWNIIFNFKVILFLFISIYNFVWAK